MRKIVKVVLPLFILFFGVIGAYYFVANKPVPVRAPAQKVMPQVRVVEAISGTSPIYVEALGIVIPSQEVALKSKVVGTIVNMSPNFQPGAMVKQEEVLLALDEADFAIELKKKEASLAKAKADYDLEVGQQSIAKSELEQLKKILPDVDTQASPLSLRQPQLAQAKANMEIALADVEVAKQNLQRTQIKAPFDAIITERSASIGQHIGTNEVLATLVDIEEYWVEVAVPIDTLYSNNILNAGVKDFPVKVSTSHGIEWEADLMQVIGALTGTSRMGKMIVRVVDPLSIHTEVKQAPLLVGDQVKVIIETARLENVISLPRATLKGANTLWLVENGKLTKKEVEVVWRDSNKVYIKNTQVPDNSLVLISDISAPIEGLEVRAIKEV